MIRLTYNGRESVLHIKVARKPETSKEKKFNRVAKLARKWGTVEPKLHKMMSQGSREAFACLLMAECGIRIGNEDSAEGYVAKVKGHEGEEVQTFGATTLRKEHVMFEGHLMILDFIGKKVVAQRIVIDKPELVEFGKRVWESADKTWLGIDAYDVQKFIDKQIDPEITIKDFRTFCANCRAYQIFGDQFADVPVPTTKRMLNAEVKALCTSVSQHLGNTPAVVKRDYLSPDMVEWMKSRRGSFLAVVEAAKEARREEREKRFKERNRKLRAQGLPIIVRTKRSRKSK